MANDVDVRPVLEAASRFFRGYNQYLQKADSDNLFALLNAIHSLGDRIEAVTGRDLLDFDEYRALKGLRNLSQHQEDVRSNFINSPTNALSDLAYMCIVRRDQVEKSIAGVHEKWRGKAQNSCETCFHWYGPAVNVYPCIFNLGVRFYELLLELGLLPEDEAIMAFEESYEHETAEEIPHYVDGRFLAPIGEIETILADLVAALPKA
jgi:hypothetical protein